MAKRSPAKLTELRRSLNSGTWKRRVADAEVQVAIIGAVESAHAEGERYEDAIARLAPGWGMSTYRKRRAKYQLDGMEALINGRPGSLRRTLVPEVEQAICILRRADGRMHVDRIAELVEQQTGIRPSPGSIRRVLHAAGLSRAPGGGPRRESEPAVEELQFAGAAFLDLADGQIGYSDRMAKEIQALTRDIPAPEAGAELRDQGSGRAESGRFTAAYNRTQNTRNGAALGPAFRSVKEKRGEVDLRRLRVARASLPTIRRKWKGLVMSPLLSRTGRIADLGDYRGGHGIREITGIAYDEDTLDRFGRDLKYLGAGAPLCEGHARFWQEQELRRTGSPPAGVGVLLPPAYFDGVSKPIFTGHFTKAGKVSANGRVMPCLDQVMVHSGLGTPLYWEIFSGHGSLVTHTLPMLARLEAVMGDRWAVDRLIVLDGEGNACHLFKEFDLKVRWFVTILRENQVKSLEDVKELTEWQPYRGGEEIAGGYVELGDSRDHKADPYRLRVAVIRRQSGRGGLKVLGSNAPAKLYETQQFADAYFRRWPAQELRFRDFNQATRFKRVTGHGKRLVMNVAVLTELDELRARKAKDEGLIARKQAVVEKARLAAKKARLGLNAAKARRTRQDNLVAEEMAAPQLDREILEARVETTQAERERYTQAEETIRKAAAKLAREQALLDKVIARQPGIDRDIADCESRREIHEADGEMDSIATSAKLGFVLLCETALLLFFSGLRISLDRLMRQILSLPGTRTVDAMTEMITIRASRNRKVMQAVESACERANALGVVRDGRVVRFSVDWGPTVLNRGANGPP